MEKDTLCVLPFIHLNIMANGQASVCCASPHALQDDTGRTLNLRTDSPSEIWNSSSLCNVRRAMLKGERPIQCSGCYSTEAGGFKSSRQNYNSMILASTDPAAPEPPFTGFTQVSRASLLEEMGKPTYFDLRFDNVCNLKCVMCYGSESSSIEKDPVHMAWTKEKPIPRIPNRFDNSRKWVASDQLFDELREIGSEAEYIRIAGGEPFRSALILRWLKYLGESGRAKHITLQIYTNLQLFNERIISLLEPFKYISMVLSIDGIGETYEYIRYPGKWSGIEESVRLLVAERSRRLKRMEVSINATMSIPGALEILGVFQFAEENGFGVSLSNAIDPPHVSTRYLPNAAKARVEKSLRDYITRHESYKGMAGLVDQWMADMYSVDITDPQHSTSVLRVMQFINDMDQSRGLDFKKLQPDLVEDYIREIGDWNSATKYVSGASEDQMQLTLGTYDGTRLSLNDRTYGILASVGGSIEFLDETPDELHIGGWAIDLPRKCKAHVVAVVVGANVVSVQTPTIRREDIEGGFGSEACPAGFKISVNVGHSTMSISDERPVRVFALSDLGYALPLAAGPDLKGSVVRVPFEIAFDP